MNLHPCKLIFLMAALLLLVACGGSAEPEVDIEATVEARLIEEGATEATLEAKVQNIVEATREAAPPLLVALIA